MVLESIFRGSLYIGLVIGKLLAGPFQTGAQFWRQSALHSRDDQARFVQDLQVGQVLGPERGQLHPHQVRQGSYRDGQAKDIPPHGLDRGMRKRLRGLGTLACGAPGLYRRVQVLAPHHPDSADHFIGDSSLVQYRHDSLKVIR